MARRPLNEAIEDSGPAEHSRLPEGWRRYSVLETHYAKANSNVSHAARGSSLFHRGGELAEFRIVYRVRAGRTPAFELVVAGTNRSLGDTWPLRREIAKHAGVDPDLVHPQWRRDANRILLGRVAPSVWFVAPADDVRREA